jgi:hypothetical protein
MENSSYIKDREKYVANLKRYEVIVSYFEKKRNENRISANGELLTSLDKTLYDYVQNGVFSRDKPIELHNRLHPLLENNLKGKLEIISARKEEIRKKRSELPLIGVFFK